VTAVLRNAKQFTVSDVSSELEQENWKILMIMLLLLLMMMARMMTMITIIIVQR